MTAGEVWVWRIDLDHAVVPPPTVAEAERAARFRTAELRSRYLRAHGALRAILGRLTDAPLDFAVTTNGKPYLPGTPELRFNLTHSDNVAMVAAALDRDVGIDVERVRPIPEHSQIAERFFPPSELAALEAVPEACREREFFRRWTRMEAMLKANGVGLFGMGTEIEGEWTVEEIDAGEGFVATVAAVGTGMRVAMKEFE